MSVLTDARPGGTAGVGDSGAACCRREADGGVKERVIRVLCEERCQGT
jgi:hypothetical protein